MGVGDATFREATTCAAAALLTAVLLTPAAHAQGNPPSLSGTYTAGPITLVFDSAGSWRADANGVEAVHGAFQLQGDTIVLHDRGGPRACPGDVAGTYTWRRTESTLVLESVADACPGRRVLAREWTVVGQMPRFEPRPCPWSRVSWRTGDRHISGPCRGLAASVDAGRRHL
jgi:hypothetical protein